MKKLLKTFTAAAMTFSTMVGLTPSQEVQAQNDKITVYMPSPAGLAENIAAGFTEESGIDVDVFQGTTGEILARLEAEKDNPIADVVVLASWADGLNMKNEDKIASFELPNKDQTVENFIDEENTLFGYSASAVGVIYNTEIFEEISADWAELGSDEQFKDQIAFPDPEKSGSAKDFVAGFVNANGWEALEKIAENGAIVPGANKAALEAVTTGEVGVLAAGVDYNGFKAADKGEPLSVYYPKSGTVINPRPAMIMKDAPNAEGAQKFIEYLFSDAAQQMVIDAYLIPGRSDIKSDKRPNADEIPTIDTDWDKMIEISDDAAAKINELMAQ